MTDAVLRRVRVVATGLSKRYGERSVLHDVTFTLEPGTVTVFIGRNGAGKSTTVRRVAGLVHGGGTVTFDGRPLFEHAEPHRVLGVDLGTLQAHPARTVRDHLTLLARALPHGHRRIADVVGILGIEHLLPLRPRAMSTGMRRAVALAAALLAEPSVLVLDEPVNGLEVAAVHRVKTALRDHAARGGTVLVASHLLAEAERLADRVLVLDGGRITADDTLAGYLDSRRPSEVEATTDDPGSLARALTAAGLPARVTGPGTVLVAGTDTRAVALAARDADVLVLGLGLRRLSLEEAFLTTGGTDSVAPDGPGRLTTTGGAW